MRYFPYFRNELEDDYDDIIIGIRGGTFCEIKSPSTTDTTNSQSKVMGYALN